MRNYIFSAVLFLFLQVPALITWAQTVNTQKGLLTIQFSHVSGKIKIYLPDDIKPGETISGTVSIEPLGTTSKQIERNLSTLKQFFIQTGNEVVPLNRIEKNFSFQIQTGSQLPENISLKNSDGTVLLEAKLPPANIPLQTQNEKSCLVPSHGLTNSPLRIRGQFDGNSSNTNWMLDNSQPLRVLAESKRQCITFFPEDAKGPHEISCNEQNLKLCQSEITGVELTVTADKLNLVKGERTTIRIRITGIQNLRDTCFLDISNNSIPIIKLEPSNQLRIPIFPDSTTNEYNNTLEVQSLRSGTFSVTVNLDLPERPGTQPLPNETTEQQCPVCACSCKAVIVLEKVEGDITTYSVRTDASCSGQFGPPPCKACAIIDAFIYDWSISFSADKPVELIGDRKGSSLKIRNKENNPFTLTATVKVTCNDGSTCTCTAKFTNHDPEIPVTYELCPGCQCECTAEIHSVDTEGDEWMYVADVIASCSEKFGNPPCTQCDVVKIEYAWSINDEKIAKIQGAANGPSVKVRTLMPGTFTISLTVTITCSDGKQCTCKDSEVEVVPEEGCLLSWVEMPGLVMSGGFISGTVKSYDIKRDDFIFFEAEGEDEDLVKFICTKLKECLEEGSVSFHKLPSRVRFEWTITGPGNFVDIGCMVESKSATGEHVIFKPPYIPLPSGKEKEASLTTTIVLTIIDEGIPALKDPDIIKTLTVKTTRIKSKPNYNKVVVTEKKTPVKPAVPVSTINTIRQCKPLAKWQDKDPIKDAEIILPAVAEPKKLMPGEWIKLEAKDNIDLDLLEADCETKKCKPKRHYSRVFSDKLQWSWTASGGTFAGSNSTSDKGRTVIFIAPSDIKTTTVIKINLTVNDLALYFDDGSKSTEIELTVYPGGIKLDYPDKDWVPDPEKPAEILSYLVYKDGDEWKKGIDHSCRIHFFELLDISNEPGTCLNAPARLSAKTCRDFKINEEEGHEAFIDTSTKVECHLKGYFLQARSELPVHSYLLKVYAEDYGAWGFIRSFANINKGGEGGIEGGPPYFIPVPVTKKEVTHPMNGQNGEDRSKKTEYADNRVNIPMDIDENRIPDQGWIVSKSRTIDDKTKVETTIVQKTSDQSFTVTHDFDNKPKADGYAGDGLSLYEEYRGFMVNKPELEHRRTDPSKKDLFVHNRDNLPVTEFEMITGIPVHQIRNDQYSGLDEAYFKKNYKNYFKNNHRFVNFNFGLAHVTDQKGLYLINEKIPKEEDGKSILGITPSEQDEANDKIRPSPPNWNIGVKVDKAKIYAECDKDPNDALERDTKLPQVVAHELCHSLNVYHHGESKDDPGLTSGNKECIMRYDNWGIRSEKPGSKLCTKTDGANESKDRGNCAGQLRISGKIDKAWTDGYPKKKL